MANSPLVPGFNIPVPGAPGAAQPAMSPLQFMTPAQLAAAAAAAYHQAPMPGGGGMGMPQQQPGFNMGNGAAMLSSSLSGYGQGGVRPTAPQGGGTGGAYNPADAAAMAARGGLDVTGGQMQFPGSPSYGDLGMAQKPDFLSGLWNSIGSAFGPRGGA